MIFRRCAIAAVLLSALALQRVQAYEFVPTALEWAAWPGYCKARYVTVPVGEASKYAFEVSRSDIDYWRSALGERNYIHVHHFCAGLSWLGRARLASTENERRFALERALEECTYTYIRIERTSIVFPEVAAGLARVAQQQGKFDDAESYLQSAINAQPDRVQPYVAMAIFLRSRARIEDGIRVLNVAEQAIGSESAELHYQLGLLNLEAGHIDEALARARRAYDLGYPLPGLRNRLTALGRWPAESSTKTQAPGG